MSDRLTVATPSDLLTALSGGLGGWSRKVIRQRLQGGCVLVNGEAIRQASFAVASGDRIEVLAVAAGKQRGTSGLPILLEDESLLAIDKPAGLLSVASAKQRKRHALGLLRDQCSTPKRPVSLWPLHRLDQDTTGVLLFAKSLAVKEQVQTHWGLAQKIYLAVVEGVVSQDKGSIDQPLRMDRKGFRAHVGAHAEAKHAVTHYQVRQRFGQRTLLEVALDTGRQHQIRAHLAWLGHPVVGDRRYGQADRCFALHAWRLLLPHPLGGGVVQIEAPLPPSLSLLLP